MCWMEAARQLLAYITVEPVLLLYMVGSTMEYTATQSLTYAKVCQGMYSSTVCDNLNLPEHKAELDAVQDSASYWMLYSNVALAVPSIISGMYIGTWSDLFGRKVPLLLPPLGELLAALVYMAMSADPSVPVGFIVLANFLSGCLGGFSGMIMCTMSYLSAVTLADQRTTRVGLLESMSFLGGFVGPFLGSLVFENAGRTWTFTALALVNSVIVLYVVALVPDVPPPRPPPSGGSACRRLVRIFSLRHVWDAVMTAMKPRADSRRGYILALLVCAFIIMVNTIGENDVTYLYVKDAPLFLDDAQYNAFYSVKHAMSAGVLIRVIDVTYLYVKDVPLSVQDSTYSAYFAFSFASASAALLVGMPLCRRWFDLSDTALSGLGLISKILGLIWLGFSVNEAMLFIVPLVAMISAFCIPPIRSLLSKLVEANEQGRVFSLMMVIENLCTLLGSALYNSVYPATRRWLHGLVFLLGAATLLVPAGVLLAVHRRLRAAGQLHTLRLPAAAREIDFPATAGDGGAAERAEDVDTAADAESVAAGERVLNATRMPAAV